MSQQGQIIAIIASLLERSDRDGTPTVGVDSLLHGEEGLGLDSLETAELSAILEDELGSDPFAIGDMPETVGDIIAFYEPSEATA